MKVAQLNQTMNFQLIKQSWKCIAFISLFTVILAVIFIQKLGFSMYSHLQYKPTAQSSFGRMDYEMKPSCINVTENMVLGSWVKDDLKQAEMTDLVNFHKKVRTFYGISQTLQRTDNLCGNETLYGKQQSAINKFRALCDPNGSTPCCFENKCALKTVEQCRCKNCYDLRQKLQAELSTWIPTDPRCQITMFADEKDACNVLKDVTIYFIGDSLIRQLYIAVLRTTRKNKQYSPLIDQTPPDKVLLCDRHYVQTSECRSWLNRSTYECNNTTRLRHIEFAYAGYMNEILELIKKLRQQRNSIVILSVGIHFKLNWLTVENQVLNPILLLLARFPWPKLIWLTLYPPGLLKSPGHTHEQLNNTVQYNRLAKDTMRAKGIPVLDFFQMIEPLMSYDGTHYGMGANAVMAQVFLNYILEMRTSA